MLPPMDKPRILDLGCGTGVPTIALVKDSGGDAVAVDTDPAALERLKARAAEEELGDRIRAIEASIIRLPDCLGLFDLVWAEGCTQFIGFKRALEYWPRFLKPNGYLVIHEDYANLDDKLRLIPNMGLALLGQFVLGPEVWWRDYYQILEAEIESFLRQAEDSNHGLEGLKEAQSELDQFNTNPKRFGSAFIVTQNNRQGRAG
jgi:SAM-dependent methyltransferase